MIAMSVLLTFTVESKVKTDVGFRRYFPWTTVAFLIGATTSIIAGYIGMTVAVYANARVALKCRKSLP